MKDKYLHNFKRIKEKHKLSKAKKEKLVCDVKLDTFDIKKARDLVEKSKKKKLGLKEKKFVMKVVGKMLNSNKKEFGVCYGYYVMLGAEYADKIGEGGRPYVKRKLLNAYKKDPEMFDSDRVERFFLRNNAKYSAIRRFIKKVSPKINYLFLLSLFYVVLGVAFFSTNLTGYVIGRDTDYSGILGGIFFLFGLLGFFIHFKKKSS